MRGWCRAKGVAPGAVISVQQCWALAQRWYRGRAERDWVRHGPERMRTIFEEVGLTSDFWSPG